MVIHCDRCNKDYQTRHGFKTHCGIKHKSDLVCRECGKDYGNKTYAEDPENFRKFARCTHRVEIQIFTFNMLPKQVKP